MASRIAISSLRASASKVRPQMVATLPQASRGMASSSNNPPPAERASEIINSLPSSPGLFTKTGSVILGSGLLATAISQELYVVNEETVILAGFAILAAFVYKSVKDPYRDWAEGNINRIKNILNASRTEHTQAVKDRIQSVEQMKDVVSITEGLFAISKETAQLESEAFVQRQKVALASEVKAVLDSWVRFEQQAKESEQADLAKTVIDNVLKNISNDKTQKEILASALAEVEQLVKSKAI
ncbi:ATP synthase subunit 4, mitochondrial [Grifola frondosa]|uniref:ATP synthase subunit 4 n=1 Tax=Grifola frondosa TaxID=5627 RepID=A0A1C7MG89_GRIFR|nr:ATP synthase subunit 4, mitochondrial [Grifola frondosa]